IMRTTTSGRPFAKDMFDFFSTLMLSLPIENNKIRFKNYPNSFWAEKAVTNLGDLQFIKSSRDADPNDPTRIITHVVRTHFSFTRDMAKNLCQAFMDAYLFESATDSSKREFQNKGLCHITPKGAHLLAKFIYRNKLPPEESRHITANATTSLLYLGRADDEDRLLLTKEHVESIFKRFAGSEPSMRKRNASGIPNANPAVSSANGHDQAPPDDNICHGVDVRDQQYKEVVYKDMFFGKAAVEWLLEHTTVISKEEAICICQEMVAAGYIEQVGKEFSTGPSLFKACGSALYHFTRIGRALAGWGGTEDGNRREPVGVSTRRSIRLLPSTGTSQLTSNTSRLYGIMSDATVRDLFNSFLKQHFCEENLSFYLDVLDYKTKFRVLIDSAEAYGQLASEQEPSQSHPPSLRALEKQICTQAFSIYETYLAPGAAREVNLPHQMRQDITAYMQAVVRNMGMSDASQSSKVKSQELIHIALFDIIHDHIFRLMSTDSVPKFIKTDKYLAVVMKKHKQRKNTTNTIHPNMVASLSAASQSIHEEVGPTDDTSNSNNSGGNEQYSCTLPTPESSCNEDESRVTETF
ncbi:regulator of G protein signaling domain-domain-containing protein, partial [Lobosporangium transversale]